MLAISRSTSGRLFRPSFRCAVSRSFTTGELGFDTDSETSTVSDKFLFPPSRVWHVRVHKSKQTELRELLWNTPALRYAIKMNAPNRNTFLKQVEGDPEVTVELRFWRPEDSGEASQLALTKEITSLGGRKWLRKENAPLPVDVSPGEALHIPPGMEDGRVQPFATSSVSAWCRGCA